MSASALPLTASQASDPGYQGKYRGCVWKEGPRCIITIMDGERVWKECVWVADKPEHVKFNAFDTGTFRVLELDFNKRRCVIDVQDDSNGDDSHRFDW